MATQSTAVPKPRRHPLRTAIHREADEFTRDRLQWAVKILEDNGSSDGENGRFTKAAALQLVLKCLDHHLSSTMHCQMYDTPVDGRFLTYGEICGHLQNCLGHPLVAAAMPDVSDSLRVEIMLLPTALFGGPTERGDALKVLRDLVRQVSESTLFTSSELKQDNLQQGIQLAPKLKELRLTYHDQETIFSGFPLLFSGFPLPLPNADGLEAYRLKGLPAHCPDANFSTSSLHSLCISDIGQTPEVVLDILRSARNLATLDVGGVRPSTAGGSGPTSTIRPQHLRSVTVRGNNVLPILNGLDVDALCKVEAWVAGTLCSEGCCTFATGSTHRCPGFDEFRPDPNPGDVLRLFAGVMDRQWRDKEPRIRWIIDSNPSQPPLGLTHRDEYRISLTQGENCIIEVEIRYPDSLDFVDLFRHILTQARASLYRVPLVADVVSLRWPPEEPLGTLVGNWLVRKLVELPEVAVVELWDSIPLPMYLAMWSRRWPGWLATRGRVDADSDGEMAEEDEAKHHFPGLERLVLYLPRGRATQAHRESLGRLVGVLKARYEGMHRYRPVDGLEEVEVHVPVGLDRYKEELEKNLPARAVLKFLEY